MARDLMREWDETFDTPAHWGVVAEIRAAGAGDLVAAYWQRHGEELAQEMNDGLGERARRALAADGRQDIADLIGPPSGAPRTRPTLAEFAVNWPTMAALLLAAAPRDGDDEAEVA